jgi:hypothetical protein
MQVRFLLGALFGDCDKKDGSAPLRMCLPTCGEGMRSQTSVRTSREQQLKMGNPDSKERRMKAPVMMSSLLLIGFACLQARCLAQLPPLSGDPQHPNLFVNGSFEKGMEGWELWSFHKVGKVSIDSEQKHDGHPSLRIDNDVADDTLALQTVTLKPFTRYRFEGWIKATKIKNEGVGKGSSGASLSLYGVDQRSQWFSDAKDWQHASMEFTTGDKAEVKLGPHIGYGFKKSTGTGWFADLSLTELGPGSHQTPKPKKR